MKTHIAIFLLFGLLMNACSKDPEKFEINDITNNRENSSSDSLSVEEFMVIGDYHNSALDYIEAQYSIAKGIKSDTLTTISDQKNFLLVCTRNYLDTVSFVVNGITIDSFYVPNTAGEWDSIQGTFNYTGITYQQYDENTGVDSAEVDSIMLSYTGGTANINYRMISTGAVYKRSLEFWGDQEDEIITACPDCNWYAIGWADAGGAYAGAGYGAILGPSGVVGGALAFGIMNSAVSGFIASKW